MKKLLALLLLICCAFSCVSCKKGGDGDGGKDNAGGNNNSEATEYLARFSAMLAQSAPTNSETVVTHDINGVVVTNSFSIQTGVVGGKKAAIYKNSVSTFGKIEDRELEYLVPKEETAWYIEGKGTSVNQGKTWKATGADFSPVPGSLSMDLSADYITSHKYEKNGAVETLIVETTSANALNLLKNFVSSKQSFDYGEKGLVDDKVTVKIIASADRISSIVIDYVIEEHDLYFEVQTNEGPVEESYLISNSLVTIEAKYSYKTDTGDLTLTLD